MQVIDFACKSVFSVYLCKQKQILCTLEHSISHNRHVFQQQRTKVHSEGVLYPDASGRVAGEVP